MTIFAIIDHALALFERITFEVKTKKSARSKKALNFEKLGSHTAEFNNPQVISVCENKIHVAIGYGLANVIVLEGEQSCVLIDTLESHEAAQEALEAIKKVVNDKPIDAIILTHFHADHTGEFYLFYFHLFQEGVSCAAWCLKCIFLP